MSCWWTGSVGPPWPAGRPESGGVRAVPSLAMGEVVDLLVVGGGPAGAAAPIRACAAGLSVVVCDKAGFPRDKTCGDGLTASALRPLQRLGVQPNPIRGLPPGGRGVRPS